MSTVAHELSEQPNPGSQYAPNPNKEACVVVVVVVALLIMIGSLRLVSSILGGARGVLLLL